MEFDALTPDEAVSRGLEILSSPRGGATPGVPDETGSVGVKAKYAVTPNPEIVQVCRRDAEAKHAVNGASLVLADGVGVIYAAKILGRPLKTRVTGIDFADALLGKCAERGYSAFLFGAKPGVAESAAENLRLRHAGLRIAGCADGYFDDDMPIIERINAAKPDLLFVCLGAPKQELWMARCAARIDAKLMVGLGGALDVWAGNIRRAPKTWQKLGLEWLYRLIKEPRRIKRMIKLPLFLFSAVAARMGGKA